MIKTQPIPDETMQNDPSVDQARLAAIVSSSDDAIISKTLDGVIQTWNKSAERIFGWTAEEAIGKPLLLIIPPDRHFEEVEILAQLRRGERIDHFETVRMRKDGSYVDVSVTVSPIRNAMGQLVGASKIARDISEQKHIQERLNEELERLVKERTVDLEKANREMEGFTYSVSHDLRGPLRSIVSSCMILREDFGPSLPAEVLEELDKQSKAAKKMADLIDDLLKLSRLGRQELRKTDLDLTTMATEIAAELLNGKCSADFKIQPGLRAHGDSPTIRLALNNLLENACKFSPNGGTIEFKSENGAFLVRDQGIGFDQQYEEKLFLPFERLVRECEYPGTGIGLANVKRVMERHGGKVWAKSEGADKGATFYFQLPDGG